MDQIIQEIKNLLTKAEDLKKEMAIPTLRMASEYSFTPNLDPPE
jgi:hypothetical protein